MQKMDMPTEGIPGEPLAEGQTRSAAAGPSRPAFIVGIGASAGGLDSLERFFRSMPEQTGIAFVVIQHPGLISACVRDAQRSGQAVRFTDVALAWKGGRISLTLLVEPFFDEKVKRRFFLLAFQGVQTVADAAGSVRQLAMDNGQELQLTRENLQTTIQRG